MKPYLLFVLLILALPWARGEGEDHPLPPVDAAVVLKQMLQHRGTRDFSLKARLFIGKEILPVDVLVRNAPDETRTIYRTGKTDLLVVQPVNGETRWFLKGSGALTGPRRMEKLAGSQFTYYDLGLPFVHWPSPKLSGIDRVRGQDCYVLELSATNQPYSKVKLWVDQKYSALLRAEVYGDNDGLVRRLAITSFKRLGEDLIPKGIDVAFILPSQALPSEEKSRLEIYEGDYEKQLPAEMFDESKFGP